MKAGFPQALLLKCFFFNLLPLNYEGKILQALIHWIKAVCGDGEDAENWCILCFQAIYCSPVAEKWRGLQSDSLVSMFSEWEIIKAENINGKDKQD